MPDGWIKMADEDDLTESDKANGLAEKLYEARDTAADAVGNLLSEIGVDRDYYRHIYKIPIGLETDSDEPGAYDPGIYGIIIGRETDEIIALSSTEHYKSDTAEKVQKRLAATIAHEMIHAIQVVKFPEGSILEHGNLSNAVRGYGGLEEGMAEALGQIAMYKQTNGGSINEAAQALEDFCAEHDAPATQMSAKLIKSASPALLSWYIKCAQTREYTENKNMLKRVLGASYDDFLEGMDTLYDYEIGDGDDDGVPECLAELAEIIDKKITQ